MIVVQSFFLRPRIGLVALLAGLAVALLAFAGIEAAGVAIAKVTKAAHKKPAKNRASCAKANAWRSQKRKRSQSPYRRRPT